MQKPLLRPACPNFSSGPCAKRPGWSLAALEGALLGRSHRAPPAKAKLAEVVDRSRGLLGIPPDWLTGIVPGSDTGAVEIALWNLLGPRPVDVLVFEAFSAAWASDITASLGLQARLLRADYGALPDLSAVDPAHDVVFAWNGTTSGVRVPHADWLPPDRPGLAICDATSAVFAMDLPWDRLDVVTWSWQKVLGGEAAHGMLALSPKAFARLHASRPAWPVPKLFRLSQGVFEADTVNTPSLLCVEDALDALRWAERIGGLPALIARSQANLAKVAAFVAATPWIGFLARRPETISPTSICLTVSDAARARRAAALLQTEHVAYDIVPYRDAPPGFRLWGGATVETTDIAALLPWLAWAWAVTASP